MSGERSDWTPPVTLQPAPRRMTTTTRTSLAARSAAASAAATQRRSTAAQWRTIHILLFLTMASSAASSDELLSAPVNTTATARRLSSSAAPPAAPPPLCEQTFGRSDSWNSLGLFCYQLAQASYTCDEWFTHNTNNNRKKLCYGVSGESNCRATCRELSPPCIASKAMLSSFTASASCSSVVP